MIEKLLSKLSEIALHDFESYSLTINYIYDNSFSNIIIDDDESTIVSIFYNLIKSFLNIKNLYSKLGDLANVPILPGSQKSLLEFTSNLNGVLACGVPGAGGYDAIFVLIVFKNISSGKDDAIKRLDFAWKNYEQNVKTIPISIETDGVKIHRI